MKKLFAIILWSLATVMSLFISCAREPVRNPVPPSSSTNPPNPPNPPSPVVVTSNNYPVDSLTGREFIFNDLSWTLDGIYTVCLINRPDLFYLFDRRLDVSISINESTWMNMVMCPYPTDPFYFVCLPPGILKIYIYNYTGPLLESTTSVKVLFL